MRDEAAGANQVVGGGAKIISGGQKPRLFDEKRRGPRDRPLERLAVRKQDLQSPNRIDKFEGGGRQWSVGANFHRRRHQRIPDLGRPGSVLESSSDKGGGDAQGPLGQQLVDKVLRGSVPGPIG